MLFVRRMGVDIALKKIFTDTSKDDKNNDNATSILQKPVVCSRKVHLNMEPVSSSA